MIKINLLPIELRKVEEKHIQFKFQPFLIGAIFILLVFSLFQFFIYLNVRIKLHKLNSKMETLQAESRDSDTLSQAINSKLLPDKKFFDKYVIPSVMVAEIMSELSSLIPDSIWLSNFRFKRDGETFFLDLSGFSRIMSKQVALAQIQEYTNLIRAKFEEILKQESATRTQEVKVTLTTNLQDIAGSEAMQFSAAFQSSSPGQGQQKAK